MGTLIRIWLVLIALLILLLVGAKHCSAETQVHTFARAIARTEGFYVKRSVPNRLHNPGDIRTRLAHAYPGQAGVYRGYAVFKNDRWGWAALESQIQRVIDGRSRRYTQDMTMTEVAKVYAENWKYWGRSVCAILHVSPDTTFQEYFGLAPRVRTDYDVPVWLQYRRDPVLPMLAVSQVSPQISGAGQWSMVAEVPEWATGEIE